MTATTLSTQLYPLPIPIVPRRENEQHASVYRFSLEQYHQMAERGILEDNNQVELLEGILVKKMTKNRAHSLATRRLRILLEGIVPTGFYVDSQEPTATSDSEPEPDVMVIRGQPEDYLLHQPAAAQVPLVAEVADSSLQHDRGWKKRIYARAEIPVYWIVNLVQRQIEVFTRPTGETENPDYSPCEVFNISQEVPVVLDGNEVGRIPVKDVLQ